MDRSDVLEIYGVWHGRRDFCLVPTAWNAWSVRDDLSPCVSRVAHISLRHCPLSPLPLLLAKWNDLARGGGCCRSVSPPEPGCAQSELLVSTWDPPDLTHNPGRQAMYERRMACPLYS